MLESRKVSTHSNLKGQLHFFELRSGMPAALEASL